MLSEVQRVQGSAPAGHPGQTLELDRLPCGSLCNAVWPYKGTCGLGDFPTATVARWIGARNRFVQARVGGRRNCSTSWAWEVLADCHFPNRAVGGEIRGMAFMVNSHHSKGTFPTEFNITFDLLLCKPRVGAFGVC